MSNYKFKTTNIKGKEYVEVNERIKFFRLEDKYSGWSLSSEVVHLDADSCVIKATIADPNGYIIATGFAQEDKSSSYINKTSYVENCGRLRRSRSPPPSAWSRRPTNRPLWRPQRNSGVRFSAKWAPAPGESGVQIRLRG